MHLEKRNGTQSQAIAYCQDEEKRVRGTVFFEHGTRSAAGRRSELDDIKEMCDSGTTIGDIASQHFGSFVRYHKGIEKYNAIISQRRGGEHDMEVEVYWGPTGTGKTRKATTENPGYFMMPNPNGGNVFCDGYDGQKCIIIDDFYGWIPFNLMLRIMDRYPCPVNTKGAVVMLNINKLVITSNDPPKEWYKNIKDHLFAAFQRRITKVIEMTTVWIPPVATTIPALIRTPRLIGLDLLRVINPPTQHTPRPVPGYYHKPAEPTIDLTREEWNSGGDEEDEDAFL